jgi:hypothetical protein
MKAYAHLPDNPEEFKRLVGLSKEDFRHLNDKLEAYLEAQKNLNPLTRRGRKGSKLAMEDRLLDPLLPSPLPGPDKLRGGLWYQRVVLP